MSYPAEELWKVLETAEIVLGGGMTFATSAELAQLIVTVYKHGNGDGGERMRACLYHDAALTKVYATGEWTDLEEAWGAATYWRGHVPLNFPAGQWPFVEAGVPYYVGIETDAYTREGLTSYLGLGYDWPLTVNDNPSALAMIAIVRQGVR